MTTTERINKFKTTAQAIENKLKSIPMDVLEQEEWVTGELINCIEKLKVHSKQVVEQASSPVKIGVVGEFSSGKTLLNGSLIGYADALPVNENATTGNVTAIRLVQQEKLQTSKFSDTITVEYLDEHRVQECLAHMLTEAEKRAKTAGLESKDISNDILGWCEWAWNESKNIELRFLIRELVQFVRVHQSYGAILCGKRDDQIDAKIAKEGLKLDDFPPDIQNLKFEELPEAPTPLSQEPKVFTADLLKSSFPLIRRVELEVKISKGIWDLTKLNSVKDFVILDFPGLGAANSG
ncbi:MAG: dynamin family protein, partial [Cyanobacteria bacterium P01_F01_bin.143]